MGKSSVNGQFSIAMLNNQRVSWNVIWFIWFFFVPSTSPKKSWRWSRIVVVLWCVVNGPITTPLVTIVSQNQWWLTVTDWKSWHGFTEGDEHTKNPRTPSLIDGWSNAKVDGYRKSPKVCSCGVKGTRVGSTNEFPGTPIVHDGSSNTGGFNPSEK